MRPALLLALLSLLAAPTHALFQSGGADEGRLERLERFLATRPFHDRIFEQLV